MTDLNPKEQWEAMFQPVSMFAGSMQKNAQTFWSSQVDILNGMHAFAEGWFERRQIRTQAAQEACERMFQAKTPMEWFREYGAWSMGAFEGLMADGLAVQQRLKQFADEVGPSLVPSMEDEQRKAAPAANRSSARAEA